MRTMKAMKYISAALLTALVAVAAGCSADRELPELTGNTTTDTPETSKTLVLTVGTPTDESTQTRVAYDDAGLKLTWQTGDQLTVAGFDADDAYKGCSTDFTYQGEENKTSGPFEGTAVSDATTYTLYYPNTVQVDQSTGDASLSMEGQTYTPDDPAAGLKNYILLKSTSKISPEADFTLEMASSIMKFDLGNIPAEVGKLAKLVWMLEDNAGNRQNLMLDFPAGAVTFGTGGGNTLTAYLGFMPSGDAMTKFTVMLVGDKIYQQEVAMAGGKTYTAGSRYTATMAGEWTEYGQMKMTVKVDDTNGLGFNIPFPTGDAVPANTVVDWGDGSSSLIPQGTKTTDNDAFNHTYSQAGAYTITITITSEKAATEQQILPMNFYSNRKGNNNAKKLISMDTPLLNMNTLELSDLFRHCSNLTTISAGLFNNNTEVTNFGGCFNICSSLAEIPAGLFDKNTAVTNFDICFKDCSSLKAIPEGLFDKNTGATFGGCFNGCSSLVEIPAGLFDKNIAVTSFTSCFQNCSNLTAIPVGLFKNNTAVTDFSGCFKNCSNLTTIPVGLFDNNLTATNFNNCFSNCTKVKLNKNIFSTDGDYSRFKDKVMNFKFCFYNAGYSAIDPGEAPELWKYDRGSATWTTSDCFSRARFTNKDGYTDEVKSAWGTPL
ncbi:hypothetical protein [Bacteroides cellulosilyticus]|jgi:hypothetical protein|uniref:hypothetical protein n=1 Tax=Bacteroides cellulosilyticus TaxID=246787 RepID=UPI000E4B9278|nr:hypothetical protein [Bacteroides cellulosilyticus]RGU22498.1 hypothetical protein DWW88_21600 [Bacteroides cellulosilyticus]